jgi:hypothetical protein
VALLSERISTLEKRFDDSSFNKKDRTTYLEKCLAERNIEIATMKKYIHELQALMGGKNQKINAMSRDLDIAISNNRKAREEHVNILRQLADKGIRVCL